ncbi:MAG: hypothetical protein CMB76_06965 [Euryarchaeota archaeon]|nr:hypothetical protein [Euryarchaeota archaeon]|tara:strand:+ start:1875 stop:2510 length:636 start_codon:yes stop_codon:yes gene_type:complete
MITRLPERPNKCDLAPPKDVVLGAKSVLGSIDFDPYSTKDINRLVSAARFIDRDEISLEQIIYQDWDCPGDKRVFVGAPTGAALTRRLINKTLKEYRAGRIEHAVLWLAHNEAIIRAPWLWDFPICIPFTRLRPTWWDDELEVFRAVAPSDWSAIVYLPPPHPSNRFQTMIGKFHTAFSHLGRIVFNEYSGETDWEDAYKSTKKHAYNYRE